MGECDAQGVVFNANFLAYVDVVPTQTWQKAPIPFAVRTALEPFLLS